MEVSIIIVAWNCRQLLSECLRSLRDQLTVNNSEIIVVDNASSDGTADAVRREFPSVKVIESSQNIGFAGGNNVGLEVSKGKLVFLINPDVVVGAECISGMLEYMEQQPDVGMLGPKIVGADGVVQRSCMRTPTLWNQLCRTLALDNLGAHSRIFGGYLMKDFENNEVRDVDIINGCFWAVRRSALDDVGKLDEGFWMYGEDLDWCQRFRMAGWRIVFYPRVQSVHHGGGSSKNCPLFCYLEMHRADLHYWRKYHRVASYCCYWCLLSFGHIVRSVVLTLMYLARHSARTETLSRLKRHLACLAWLASPNRHQPC